jgi:hypothetical protein
LVPQFILLRTAASCNGTCRPANCSTAGWRRKLFCDNMSQSNIQLVHRRSVSNRAARCDSPKKCLRRRKPVQEGLVELVRAAVYNTPSGQGRLSQ